MPINFYSPGNFYRLRNKKPVRAWLMSIAKREKATINELNYIFCNDDYLLQLNIEYLRHDTLTDVITFDNSLQAKKISGDIYISINSVTRNAKAYKETFSDELHRVMAHGLLHLCGYADKPAKAKKLMTEKEDLYLEKRKIK